TADLIKGTGTIRFIFGPHLIILKKVHRKKWLTVQPSVTNNGSAYPDNERSSSLLMPVLLTPVNLKRQNGIIVHLNTKSDDINGRQNTNNSKVKFNSS
ncbi:unnamed protein product, partial [Hymenolepis diminuta]